MLSFSWVPFQGPFALPPTLPGTLSWIIFCWMPRVS